MHYAVLYRLSGFPGIQTFGHSPRLCLVSCDKSTLFDIFTSFSSADRSSRFAQLWQPSDAGIPHNIIVGEQIDFLINYEERYMF